MKVSDLCTDLYQRHLRPNHLAYLNATWDDDALGIPLVSCRDGRNYVVDGQHRVEALKIKEGPNATVLCEVRYGLTHDQEVVLFLKRNKALKPDACDVFNARLENGDVRAHAVKKIVEEFGYRISRHGSKDMTGVVALESAYILSPDALRWALGIVREAYPNENRPNAYVVGALAVLGKHFSRLAKPDRVIRALTEAAVDTGLLQRRLRRIALDLNLSAGNDARGVAFAQALLHLYNTRGYGRRLAW